MTPPRQNTFEYSLINFKDILKCRQSTIGANDVGKNNISDKSSSRDRPADLLIKKYNL
jgi:hypothetical protein